MAVRKEYKHYVIAIVIGLVLNFGLRPNNGLTDLGVRVIAVIIMTLYLWITTNTHWTCFMILGLLVMTEAMTADEVWANSMGHFIFITILVYMIFNMCLAETGVINKIAKFFITRNFVKDRPFVFLGMFFLSHLCIGFFVDGVSLAAIYIGIIEEIAKNLKIKKGDPMYTVLMLGTLWTNCLLAIGSPIGHALPNIIIGLLESACGVSISYAAWMGFGAIYSIIIYIVMMLIIKIWNPDCSAFKNFDLEEVRKNDKELDKAGKWAAAIFSLVIFFVIAPTLLMQVTPFFAYFSRLGVVVPALIGIVVLCIIHVDGKPVMDLPEIMKKVNYPPIIFAGTVACLAVPVAADNTGIAAWLINTLSPLLSRVDSSLLVILLIILAMLMTNFLSNTVTETLFFSIGAALLSAVNYNMAAFAIIIAIASGMSTATPSAAVPSPFFFGPGHLTMRNTIIPNLAFLAAAFVVITFVALPLANVLL